MRFHILVNDDDYVAFSIYSALNSPTNKKVVTIMRIIMAAQPFIFNIYNIVSNLREYGITLGMVFVLIECFFWFFALPVLYKWIHILFLKLHRKYGKYPYSPNSMIEFGEDDIYEETSTTTLRVPYSDITDVYMDDTRMYIFSNTGQAFILPVKCLEGKEKELFVFIRTKRNL